MRETYTVHTDHYPAILSRDGEAWAAGKRFGLDHTGMKRMTYDQLTIEYRNRVLDGIPRAGHAYIEQVYITVMWEE